MGKINLSGLVDSSIVDGPGVRFAIYTQGCAHGCIGCHNRDTWSTKINQLYDIDQLVKHIEDESLSKNVTLTGGDPLLQIDASYELCKKLKAKDYNIWLYTGYTIEQIEANQSLSSILEVVDCIVDGRFEQDLKDFSLDYRGSSNQRIIEIKK
ncbi:anaerobic ribonucleoside-triphosphate reductase activating protein [Mollicutes bacterium LVI A0075]|nr:anaerobic ribonucleoside-triphosphate reductase activating protein [Mollicutes bacterium LVI A0075]